ncbi:solute carrier family 46 member 3 [Elysia marginata]|uniref:Solute carrier family 46 member 3 n=1 Tax=Elysia marginata TaxID=1093978 RepID=A0AAV4G5Z9_9GAST|nr:solute carrier family 46 member 3 [Elysia marginata]
MGLCLLFFLPVLSTFCHMSDISIIFIGLGCKLVRALWAGFCVETWMVFVSVVIGSLSGVVASALRSILSKSVSDDETGKVFALASSTETAAKLIGSVVFVNIYAATLHVWSGIAYMCSALVYFALVVIMVWLYKEVQLRSRHGLTNGISGYWTFSPRDTTDGICSPTNQARSPSGKARGQRNVENGGGGGGKRNKLATLPTIREPETDSCPTEKDGELLLPLSASATNLSGRPVGSSP